MVDNPFGSDDITVDLPSLDPPATDSPLVEEEKNDKDFVTPDEAFEQPIEEVKPKTITEMNAEELLAAAEEIRLAHNGELGSIGRASPYWDLMNRYRGKLAGNF